MAVATTLFLVGTALSIKSNLDASRARADQARQEAQARRSQAEELLRRGDVSLKNIQLEGEQFLSSQQASFVRGGVDISSTTSLSVLEETQRQLSEQFIQTQREVSFNINSILEGASSLDDSAKRIEDAATVNAFGQAISSGGQLFLASGGSKKG